MAVTINVPMVSAIGDAPGELARRVCGQHALSGLDVPETVTPDGTDELQRPLCTSQDPYEADIPGGRLAGLGKAHRAGRTGRMRPQKLRPRHDLLDRDRRAIPAPRRTRIEA